MVRKLTLIFVSSLFVVITYAQTDDSTYQKRYKPKDKSWSTYIVLAGLIQNINLGLESSSYYQLTTQNAILPLANLRYIRNKNHSFGLKLGMSFQDNSTTKSDSLFFRSIITPTKISHNIPLDPSYSGYYEDVVSTKASSVMLVPFYEYHFGNNRRWDYFLALEYMLRFQVAPVTKNFETITYRNTNKDELVYTNTNASSVVLTNHGAIAALGVNYFIFRWLSVGTKVSYSVQSGYTNPLVYTEMLLVNGVDRTSSLLITNTSKTLVNSNSYSGFLNNGYAGFLFNFYL